MGTYGKLMELNQPLKVVPVEPQEPQSSVDVPPVVDTPQTRKQPKPQYRDTKQPRYHDTVIPRHHETIIQLIRSAVKQFGKEAATHRFTMDEKRAIADVVYAYRKEGIKTSENEISRIGVNFLIEDYKTNGEKSILDKALKALNE